MPLLGRNRSWPFHRALDIVQVLQDGLFRHALEQKHNWDRHESRNDTLMLGLMRSSQSHAATALANAHGGQEYKSITFFFGLVELVLNGISDPLFRGSRLAEEYPGLSPP